MFCNTHKKWTGSLELVSGEQFRYLRTLLPVQHVQEAEQQVIQITKHYSDAIIYYYLLFKRNYLTVSLVNSALLFTITYKPSENYE